jgi:hypothetical protein
LCIAVSTVTWMNSCLPPPVLLIPLDSAHTDEWLGEFFPETLISYRVWLPKNMV